MKKNLAVAGATVSCCDWRFSKFDDFARNQLPRPRLCMLMTFLCQFVFMKYDLGLGVFTLCKISSHFCCDQETEMKTIKKKKTLKDICGTQCLQIQQEIIIKLL